MSFDDINDGLRPSRMELARFATGELEGEYKKRIEAWLVDHPEDLAWLAEVEQAREDTPPFSRDLIHARAQAGPPQPVQIIGEDLRPPAPANNYRWMTLAAGAIGLASMAAVAAAVLVLQPPPPVDAPQYDGIKSGHPELEVFALDPDEKLRPYDGRTLGQGDVLGFQVYGERYHSVVVLSVDGSGTISVFYPGPEQSTQTLGTSEEAGLQPLPGTIVLDDAPGPEVFLALFGKDVPEAVSTVSAQSLAGQDALLDWARRTPWAEAELVTRIHTAQAEEGEDFEDLPELP